MQRPSVTLAVSIASLAPLFLPQAQADVRLPKILGDHMVLQSGKPANFWGWADPGEAVTVSAEGKSAKSVAGADGKWALQLELPQGRAPFTVTVSGKNQITLEDVLAGDVWICSGQSNMEWTVGQSENPQQEAAEANYPGIRHFKVKRNATAEVQEDVDGQWVVCSPATVGGFTAVGYFFGREIHQKTGGTPIGLIGSNWGGTPVEAWTRRGVLEACPEASPTLQRWDKLVADFNPEKAATDYQKALADWELKAQEAKEAGKPAPPKPNPANPPATNPNRPANLYNGMIAPLLPLRVKGAIWYQGESNVERAVQYRTLFPLLIQSWRRDFNLPEMPFYFVQIAPHDYTKYRPGADPTPCAELWESQLMTLRSVPHTGMAVTNDVGNIEDIHPKKKQPVGKRLALWALKNDYELKDVTVSGPLYRSAKVEGNKIRLEFDYAEGLKARDGQPLTHFTIAGADRKFVEAKATVEGNSLVVSSDAVAQPVAVRFAWHHSAEPNLVNGADLPASPFRTDDFPAVTAGKF